MRIAIYIVWALIPIGYFLSALWAKLEQMTNQRKKNFREAGDITKQAFVVTGMVGICYLIDIFLMDNTIAPLLPSFVPKEFAELILLPLVMYIGALAMGGTDPIRITKAPKVATQTTESRKSAMKAKKRGKKKR